MFNKKRIAVFGVFFLFMFVFITFAGGTPQNQAIATRDVTFIDSYNNEQLSAQKVIVGEDAEVPAEPRHDGYIFVGWYLNDDQSVKVEDFTNIIENLSVVAKYAGDSNRNGIADDLEPRYTVRFIDTFDGRVLSTVTVLTGMAAQAPTVPTHKNMVFTGWSVPYQRVTSDLTVNTVYTTSITSTVTDPSSPREEDNYYNVTFIDTISNEVIVTERVREGLSASTPREPKQEGYLFVRWNGDFTNVNSDREIYTVYVKDENGNGVDDVLETKYSVSFDALENGVIVNGDGTTQSVYVVNNILSGTKFGTVVSNLPEVKANQNYIVDGWNELIPDSDFEITEDLVFTAKYKEDKNNNGVADENETLLKVTFYDTISNKVLKVEEVLPGMDASEPKVEKYDQKLFKGWDKEFTNVNEDITVNTIYVDDLNNNGIDDREEEDTKRVLTIEYVSLNPTTGMYNELMPNKTMELLPGQPYSINPEKIDWYTLSLENINEETMTLDGIMPEEDTTVRFIYTPGEDKNNNGIDDREEVGTERTLTVLYESYNKKEDIFNTLKTQEELKLLPGEPYEISAPSIENYTISEEDAKVSGVMGDADSTVKFIYTPIGEDKNEDGIPDSIQTKSTLTIKYVSFNSESGKEYILDTLVIEDVVQDLEYKVEPKLFDGYKFDSNKTEDLTFNMPDNDYTFIVYYSVDGKDENQDGKNDKYEDKFTLKIEYISVKEDGSFGESLGHEIVRTDFVLNESFDITDIVNEKTEALIDNYTLFNEPTLKGVISLTNTVDNVYTVTVSYRPNVDENNNGVLDSKEPDKYTLEIRYVSVYNENGVEKIGKDFGTDVSEKSYVLGSKYDVKALVDIKASLLESKYQVVDRTSETGKIVSSDNLKNVIVIKFKPIDGTDENNNGINDLEEKHYELNVKYVVVNRKGEIVNDNFGSDYVGSYVSGAIYNVSAPNFKDYTLVNREEVSGVMPSSNKTVILQYRITDPEKDLNDNGILDEKESQYTLTVKYVSKGNNQDYVIDTKSYQFVGNAVYTLSVPENILNKYVLVGDSTLTGTMPSMNTTIIVEYKVIDGKDINGNGQHDDDETQIELVVNLVRKELNKTVVLDTINEKYLVGQEYEIELPNELENGKYIINRDSNILSGVMPSTKTVIEIEYKAKNDVNGDGIADEDQATVKYVDFDGTVLFNEMVTKGEKTPIISEPTREAYIFAGWTPKVSETVIEDIIYTAEYKEDKNKDGIDDEIQDSYIVNFYGFNNELLKSETVLVKMSATAPQVPNINGYTFKGWDKEFTNVRANLDVKAIYVDETEPLIDLDVTLYEHDTKASITGIVTDAGTGVKEVRYSKGNLSLEEAKNGKEILLDSNSFELLDIKENGYYTIYAKDNAGNETIKLVLVEGIIVNDGNFEDTYANGSFGELSGFPLLGTYKKDLSISTKDGVKIVEAREFIGESYKNTEDFSDSSLGTNIIEDVTSDRKNLNHKIKGRFGNYVTIYVKYEYQEEVSPNNFETKYVTRTYKTFLSYIWGQNSEE